MEMDDVQVENYQELSPEELEMIRSQRGLEVDPSVVSQSIRSKVSYMSNTNHLKRSPVKNAYLHHFNVCRDKQSVMSVKTRHSQIDRLEGELEREKQQRLKLQREVEELKSIIHSQMGY